MAAAAPPSAQVGRRRDVRRRGCSRRKITVAALPLASLFLLLLGLELAAAKPRAHAQRYRPEQGDADARRTAAAGHRGTAAAADHRGDTQTRTHPGRRGGGGGGGDIIFPDSQYKPRLGGRLPACARGSTFCEDVDGYPSNHLASILNNSLAYREFFGSDYIPVSDRIGQERTLCDTQEKIIYPKMAQTANNEWLYVANLEGDYKQGVRVEMCGKEDSPCHMASNLPQGSHATCRQKYIYRKLVALTESGDPLPEAFRLPSCCACFVEDSVLSRAGFGGGAPASNASAHGTTQRASAHGATPRASAHGATTHGRSGANSR